MRRPEAWHGRWRAKLETALIVGLALLVVIKGFGAVSGVASALFDMALDLWSLLVA